MEINEIFNKLNIVSVKREADKELLKQRKERHEELLKDLETISKSQVFVQTIAEEVQSQLSSKIDNIVNLGLATCFPEYTFQLKYVPSRGKTEVNFVFMKGEDVVDIMNQNGGGMVDLACFSLRVAVYSISNNDNVICLDEPFKYVSRTLRPKVAELISALSEQLHLQFIYVTHIDELSESANKKVLIKKIKNISEVIK